MKSKLDKILFTQVNIAPLVVFRIIFGALMLFGVCRFLLKGWVNELYILPEYHFTYLGFEWIRPLPEIWMYLPFILMLMASICIILGLKYKLASFTFFICFTYVELIDKTYYLNHYYFVSLVAFLMIFVDANRYFSLDVYHNPNMKSNTCPQWHIGIIKFQLIVVYFFAGVAKLEKDWLFKAQPLKTWLQAYRDLPLIGFLFAKTWLAFVFSWFGCIYDLTIGFFLLKAKTRAYAYFFVVVFHIITWLLFPIGVFPWVMICSTLIFFSSEFHQKLLFWLKKILNIKTIDEKIRSEYKIFKTTKYAIILFCFFQLVIPFRYLAYPTHVFWTEEGFRFSWRVMLMHKEGYATFYIQDKKTKQSIEINNSNYLTPIQIDQMATQGDFILQYAHLLKSKFKDTLLQFGTKKFHLKDPEITAKIFVSLNGRVSQLYVNDNKDLGKIPYNLKARTWIEKQKF